MKQTNQSNPSSQKQGRGKEQNAVRQNLENFGDKSTSSETREASDAVPRKDDEASKDLDPVTASFKDFGSSVDKFAGGLASSTIDQAKSTVEQARVTMQHLGEAMNQAKETVTQLKATVDSVKETAKQVLVHMRKNPEPFIAAAIPGLIGVYLLLQKMRKAST
jgi:methyl-accepting chemotaxis protein